MHFSLIMTIVLYICFLGGKIYFITDVGSELDIFFFKFFVPPNAVFQDVKDTKKIPRA